MVASRWPTLRAWVEVNREKLRARAAILRAKGIDSTRYVLSGADHGDLSFMGNMTAVKPWSTQETMNHIVDFLHQHLGG